MSAMIASLTISEDYFGCCQQKGAVCLQRLSNDALLNRPRKATARMLAAGMADLGQRVEEPRSTASMPCHQDQTHWPFVADDAGLVWVAKDHSFHESHGSQYVHGSQRSVRRFDPNNKSIPETEGLPGEYKLLSWDTAPGDCLLRHALTVHAAGDDRLSKHRRSAISTRWAGDAAYLRPRGSSHSDNIGLMGGRADGDPIVFRRFHRPRLKLNSETPSASCKAIGVSNDGTCS